MTPSLRISHECDGTRRPQPPAPSGLSPSRDGLRLILAGVAYLLAICLRQLVAVFGNVGLGPKILPANAMEVPDVVALYGPLRLGRFHDFRGNCDHHTQSLAGSRAATTASPPSSRSRQRRPGRVLLSGVSDSEQHAIGCISGDPIALLPRLRSRSRGNPHPLNPIGGRNPVAGSTADPPVALKVLFAPTRTSVLDLISDPNLRTPSARHAHFWRLEPRGTLPGFSFTQGADHMPSHDQSVARRIGSGYSGRSWGQRLHSQARTGP